MSEPIKYIDINEFREEGYLQEVNRCFLHPLGLALEVRSPLTREEVEKHLKDAGVQFGSDAIDNVMTFARVYGLTEWHVGGIWDDRDDPEGTNYGDGFDGDKAKNINHLWSEKGKTRNSALGYVIQPYPGEPK